MPRPDRQAHLRDLLIASRGNTQARSRQLRWIEDGTALVLAMIGSAVFSMLIMLGVYLSFLFAAPPSIG